MRHQILAKVIWFVKIKTIRNIRITLIVLSYAHANSVSKAGQFACFSFVLFFLFSYETKSKKKSYIIKFSLSVCVCVCVCVCEYVCMYVGPE